MILIPNRNMPETCDKCPCMYDGNCSAMTENEEYYPYDYTVGFHGRQPYCPLIEAKPGITVNKKHRVITILFGAEAGAKEKTL